MSKFELNKGDNFIFAIDVSGSMSHSDCPGNASRIDFCKEKAIAFAKEASKWDEDGIDVLTFGHQINTFKNVTAEKAEEIIGKVKATEMSTDTAGVIKAGFNLHSEGGYEQSVLFVVTDGEPNDREAVKKTIVDISNGLPDDKTFNISFLTVGQPAPELTKFLNGLDDDLKGAKFDIVDVKKLEEVDFIEAFAGALND